MADISVSNTGGNGGIMAGGLGRAVGALTVAFVLIFVLHSFFGGQLGTMVTWLATAVVMAAAAYFVAQGEGAGLAEDDSERMIDLEGQVEALKRSQAVIEFNLNGTIINANDNFLNAMGYTLAEIQGQHHRMFVEPIYGESAEYRDFWARLARGEYVAGEFKRIAKGGDEVWIQASYNPVLNREGNPVKIVKYATDITAQKTQSADFAGQIEAISKSQAVIEFDMDGTIITANENFCKAMGYDLSEIQGKHHSLFAPAGVAESQEYKEFWAALNRGEFSEDQYQRVGKGGKEVWIQASYNPINDLNGHPFKVVKYATDITEQKLQAADFAGQIEAIGKSQAVIEFTMDGTILAANENFCKTMGYDLSEIQGKHHSMFAEPGVAGSPEYKAFWEQLGRGEYEAGEFKRIGKGGAEVWIQASYNPILDMNGKPFKVVKYATDITDQVKEAAINAQNARIKVALDSASASLMIADLDFNIFYMNDSMVEMMENAESDLQTELPSFDAANLLGAKIDVFYDDASQQKRLLGSLKDTYRTEMVIGGRTFKLIANPVVDRAGERFGTSLDWTDITLERGIESEIAQVVDAAVAGDLTQRVDLEGKDGFLLNVSKGLNDFAGTCDAGLSDVANMLESMAAGDLTARITNEYEGTFNDLKQNANDTADKLSEVLGQIVLGAGEVSNAATEISDGSNDLSQRTEQQASSLEETAASMEEMESAVKTNADNAAQANKQGSTARDVAEKGGEVVNNAVNAMSRIEDSSQKISDIIVVIDEIAFQTNLLALNAAVEAARAGDAGKGFAVVASEVRALAQRSSEAAKDIKALIVDSNNQVKDGVELVNEAGEQLGEIVRSISEVTNLVSEIASANQEQATGIAEINRAIAEMDEMTQQNSALVEETAASARTLEEQSEVMQDRVSFFSTGDTQVVAPVRAARSAAGTSAKAPKKRKKSEAAGSSVEDDDWAEF